VLPIGASDIGGSILPCGMQVVGPRWRDLDCIAAARDIDLIING
jgi:amidase